MSPKELIQRLTPTATRSLEAAVGRAAAADHGEIGVAHFVLELLEEDGGDAALLCAAARLDRAGLRQHLRAWLGELAVASGRRPIFSKYLFELIDDAWKKAQQSRSAPRVRSGDVFLAFLRKPWAWLEVSYPELDAAAQRTVGIEDAAASAETAEGMEGAMRAADETAFVRDALEARLRRDATVLDAAACAQLVAAYRQGTERLEGERLAAWRAMAVAAIGGGASVEGAIRVASEAVASLDGGEHHAGDPARRPDEEEGMANEGAMSVGERWVLAGRGVFEVAAIESHTLQGATRDMVVLVSHRVAAPGNRVMVPVDRTPPDGWRRPISADEAREVLAALEDASPVRVRPGLDSRARRFAERDEPSVWAELVRELGARAKELDLQPPTKHQLLVLRDRLAEELAAALDTDFESMGRRLDAAIASASPA